MEYIYLAGPIKGQTYKQATEWRKKVAKALDSKNVQCFSPLRGKEYLKNTGVLTNGTYDGVLTTAKAIMRRDFFDCVRSTVVVVNLLGTRQLSIGTIMEIAWCYQSQIPAIIIMEEDNIHHHVMLDDAATYVVPTLKEAISVTKILLNEK